MLKLLKGLVLVFGLSVFFLTSYSLTQDATAKEGADKKVTCNYNAQGEMTGIDCDDNGTKECEDESCPVMGQ